LKDLHATYNLKSSKKVKKMKQFLNSSRSKYLFALGLLAIFIGLISKKVITYPTECAPSNNKEIAYLFKI